MKLTELSDSELINFISELEDIKSMKLTADCKSSIACGVRVGIGATIGSSWGLLGATVGALLGALASMPRGQCRNATKFFKNDLKEDHKKILADAIRNLASTRRIWTTESLSDNFTYNSDFKKDLISTVITFIKQTLHYNVYEKNKEK